MPTSRSLPAGTLARRLTLVVVVVLLVFSRLPIGVAQKPKPDGTELMPIARFITLKSPITDDTIAWVRRTGLELQDRAVREKRKAYLVLEFTPGNSQFHHVFGLADFLTSAALSNVTTVAWIPETVTGFNVVPALACNEIVMHPDAQLGDIGRGKSLEPDQQAVVRAMVAKRRNRKVNEAVAEALMDPQSTLVQLTVEPAAGMTEKRVVDQEEAERLLNTALVIKDRVTLKESGALGLFSGTTARNHDILVVQTVESRPELADVYGLPLETLREQRSPGTAEQVSLIEIRGEIEPVLESFLKRQIDRAVERGSKTIIFEIDSPGGFLWESRDMAMTIADLEERDIRTIAYIPDMALSGAAIIALGCDEIYMKPTAKIGDAGPIEIREGGQFERADEKVLSFLLEVMEELAERKGRPKAVAMAMADKEMAVFEVTHKNRGTVWYMTEDELHEAGDEWIKGRQVPESRDSLLLTLDGKRANQLKIAEPPVEDFSELKERVGIPLDVTPMKIGRTWIDSLVFLLNHGFVTGLLFFIGIICIYLELHFMTGLLGIVSAVCFALFFWSKVLGGTAGWLEVVLFMLGIGCLAMEIFVIPGFGVFGVSGGLLIFAALIMASQTFGNLEPSRDFDQATETLKTLSASIVAVVVIAMLLSRFLPRIPLFNEMFLTPPGMHEAGVSDAPRLKHSLTHPGAELIGERGRTVTVLRPAGKAQVENRLLDVVSDGPFIDEGSEIEVVHVTGNRVVVRQIS